MSATYAVSDWQPLGAGVYRSIMDGAPVPVRRSRDDHHRHGHDEPVGDGVSHVHWHRHAPLAHTHEHYPDAHHRLPH